MTDHLYTADGDIFTPSPWAGSPWSTTSQHGGPSNALFMRAVENLAADAGMQPGRLSVDILKPIPMAPLRLGADFLRRGKRLGVIQAALQRADDNSLVAIARAVALKAHEDQVPVFGAPETSYPSPDEAAECELISEHRKKNGPHGFHFSIRMRHGGAADDTITWFTWPLDILEAEAPSPYQRCAAICDLTTVVSGRLAKSAPGTWDNEQQFLLLNTDTTVHLFRPPVGDWFGFSNTSIADHRGIGVASAMLHDEQGPVGRSVQTVASNA